MSDTPAPEPPAPDSSAAESAVPAPRCMHFYCKAMLVYGEAFEDDPDWQAGMSDIWCQQTQKPYGPDNGEVSLPMCCDPKRPCYQAY